jgi:SAM-dependent methyltransferase
VDLSEELLQVARARCPDVPLHRADMADFDLGRTFDVVTCLFSSIAYVRSLERMRAATEAMARHVAPGGLLLLEPWFPPERYWTGTITANFVDRPDLKIAWMYTSDPPAGRLAVLDISYLVGTVEGVEHFEERHELGLFTDEEHRQAFRDAGLEVEHDETGIFGRGMYLGRRS